MVNARNLHGKTVRFIDPPDGFALDSIVEFEIAGTRRCGILLLVSVYEKVQEALIGIYQPDGSRVPTFYCTSLDEICAVPPSGRTT